ncbi:MAG: hypothetical protein PVF47_15385 [Anaerolineae bacterium]|jgi:hypothetical protein
MADSYRSQHYRSYLLRLWLEHGENPNLPGVWRYSLEDPHTGEKLGFASLESLLAFLQQQTSLAGPLGRQGTGDDPPSGQRRPEEDL